MDALDTSIINTAIPAMSRSLQVNPVDLKIALLSYLICLAIFIPTSGWVADKFGVKFVFISSLVVFTLSSLWCGYAQTLPELVIARASQGVGGALMLPVGRLIILRTFQRHELVDAMNHVIMVVSVGVMLGPLAGGFITDHFSWHWIFWVNIPVGLLAMAAAFFWIKDITPKKARPFDLVGFVLFGGGLAMLTFALSDLSESTADQAKALYILFIALFMLLSFYFYARKKIHPIINIKLFRIRTFQISIIGNFISRLSFGGMPFLLPLLFQIGLGYSAELSGLLLVPIALGIMMVKYFSLKILRMAGYRRILVANTVLVACALLAFRIVGPDTSLYVIAGLTFIFGLLISLQYSGMNSLAYADMSADDMSSATSIISTAQQIAQSLGVATAALLLRFYSVGSADVFSLTPAIFHQTFFALGTLSFLTAFFFLRLKRNDGHQMLTAPAQEKVAVH